MSWTHDVDPSGTVEIERCPRRFLVLMTLSGVMLVAAVAIIVRGPSITGLHVWLLGGGGVLLLVVAGGLMMSLRLISGGMTPLVLSPSGLTYRDFWHQEIPWTAIREASVWTYRGASAVCVRIAPETAAAIRPTWARRLARPFSSACAVYISDDMDIEVSDLRDLIRIYAEAHAPGSLQA